MCSSVGWQELSGLSVLLSLLLQEAEDSLKAGPVPEVGVCIQEEVVSWMVTQKWFTPGQVQVFQRSS